MHDSLVDHLVERRRGRHAPNSVLCDGWPELRIERRPGADHPRSRPRYS